MTPKLKAFETYAGQLEMLASHILSKPELCVDRRKDLLVALDGGSSAALRRVVSIEKRRKMGAFFTSSLLAERALEFFKEPIPDGAVFLDFACGAGDLLLAAARRLPNDQDLQSTLSLWGQRLIGFDLQSEFVRAAKVRLLLLAIEQVAPNTELAIDVHEQFPFLQTADGLTQLEDLSEVTHIIINPSFAKQTVPEGCTWATKKVSSAAVFLHACVSRAEEGTKIVAILPDVLRSGSNYKNWRREIAARAAIEEIKLIGRFDKWTDVDVFMIRLTVGADDHQVGDADWWNGNHELGEIKVSDRFDVEVGGVVPHRDKKKGRWYAYVYSRLLPRWGTVRTFKEHRRSRGKVFKPPFVAVRRTSSPSDEFRAVGTLISGTELVAVENHLIVLTPKDGLVRTCRELLQVLQNRKTNDWLNERIRCRHLTVPALQELPFGGNRNE
jgi:hypothetical protein